VPLILLGGVVFLAALAVVCFCVYERTRVRSRRAARGADGTQRAAVVVDRGYAPSRIELEAGVPAVLRFERREEDPCTELLVSELWPSAHRLVAHGATEIRFTPQQAGRYVFTCGLGMYSGELVVRPARRKNVNVRGATDGNAAGDPAPRAALPPVPAADAVHASRLRARSRRTR